MSIAEEFEFYKHEAGKVNFYRDKASALYEELQHYKDLEEQGRLIELPCKVGTPIYYISKKVNGRWYVGEYYFNLAYVNDFGKTVFLTREEAEIRLKELEEEI